MCSKCVLIANTVFLVHSEIDLGWGGNLALFQSEEEADIILHVRNTFPGEETLDAGGYAKVQRSGNRFLVALPAKWYVQPTLWQVLNLLPLSALLLERGTLTMHASYICRGGEGILFSGPSGVGKSTQAALWHKYRGTQVVNGDRVLITPGKDGTMVASHYLSGTSGVCSNVTSPLKAIVLLEQAEENAIRPTSAWQILRLLMGQIDYPVSDREQLIKVSGLVERMLRKTIVCRYGCKIDEDAVDTLEKYLYEE
jgi:hypothetical protein